VIVEYRRGLDVVSGVSAAGGPMSRPWQTAASLDDPIGADIYGSCSRVSGRRCRTAESGYERCDAVDVHVRTPTAELRFRR